MTVTEEVPQETCEPGTSRIRTSSVKCSSSRAAFQVASKLTKNSEENIRTRKVKLYMSEFPV